MPLVGCVSATTQLYRGDMELVTVSGDACPDNIKANANIQLELVLEENRSNNEKNISGYLSGPEIQTGKISGNDYSNLQIRYPDESDSVSQIHTLHMNSTSDGMSGELHEKPHGSSSQCFFEEAVLKLKNSGTGGEAAAAFKRQQKLFVADELFNSGLALLKNNKPVEALLKLTESQKLQNELDPFGANSTYQTFSIASAYIMAGQTNNAQDTLRNLFAEDQAFGTNNSKKRFDVIRRLCAFTYDSKDDVRQKSAEQLLDEAARNYGGITGSGMAFAECYREFGRNLIEQEEVDHAIEYFLKALAQDPNDADSIAGVLVGNIARATPANGRIFLQEHAQIVITKTGRDNYNLALTNLYIAEANQAEKNKEFAQAENLIRETLKIFPNEHGLVIRLSRILEKRGKPDEALKLLESASSDCKETNCSLAYEKELVHQKQIDGIVKRIEGE
jgi:tetratricopeptide (TPR) repeat protein